MDVLSRAMSAVLLSALSAALLAPASSADVLPSPDDPVSEAASARSQSALVEQRTAALAQIAAQIEQETARRAAEAERARVAAEQAAVAAKLKKQGSATVGGMVHPAPGPVSSLFGMRVHPITGVFKPHTGTDFRADCGTPVVAAAPGTVTMVGIDPAYGNRIVVKHSATIQTTYNHLSVIAVKPGAKVDGTTVIGQVGTTGLSTGCHLHFEVVQNGSVVDPLPWVRK